MSAETLTPAEWCEMHGLAVMDPDGWRGSNGRPWEDAITEAEFKHRFRMCTIRYDLVARAYLGESA